MKKTTRRRPSVQPASQSVTWITPAQRAALDAEDTTAHRLASGPGGWVERLGDDVIVSFRNDPAKAELLAGLPDSARGDDWAPSRVFTRFMPTRNADRVSPRLLRGDESASWKTTVTEAAVRYGLDIGAGYSHGLFLDQRLNRARLRRLRPRRVLNTFAYTCSFSVTAALAGAETTSVDLSRKSLNRGRRNFQLNGLDPEQHRFVAGDTMELLPRLAAEEQAFDAIILDPPTFSRSGSGRRWRVEDHIEALLLAALDVAAPRCSILLSTNCAKLDSAELVRRARLCAKVRRRPADFLEPPSPLDFPPDHGASTAWMTLR